MADGFTLRVPVRPIGRRPITDLDRFDPIEVDGIVVRLSASDPLIVFTAGPFPTEAAAEAFIPRVKLALWWILLRWNIAFRGDFARREVTFTDDPVAAGHNLARSFGLADESPVHGIVEGDAVVVIPPAKTIRYLMTGHAATTVSTPAEWLRATLEAAIRVTNPAGRVDSTLELAMDLLNGYFYETSIRAKLLTLITILEVLAPIALKHEAAVRLIKAWKTELSAELAAVEDGDARQALESLDRELDFRRETSIRQRVRALVRRELSALPSVDSLERDAVGAYDARGTLSHTGHLEPAELADAHERALRVVGAVLTRRLGMPEDS